MKPGIPESFKVVISELQSLGLQVDLKKDVKEVLPEKKQEPLMAADAEDLDESFLEDEDVLIAGLTNEDGEE